MSGTLYGADLEGLDELSDHFARASQSIRTLGDIIGAGVTESDRYWHGPDAAGFKQQWFGSHRAALMAASLSLNEAAEEIRRNRAEQAVTSSIDDNGYGPTGHPGTGDWGLGGWPGPGGWPGLSGWPGGLPPLGYGSGALAGFGLGPIADFLFGDVANFWNGGADDSFPVGQLGAGLVRVFRTAAFATGYGPFPTFNTGLIGRGLGGILTRIPAVSQYGAWLGTPAATTFFTRVGIAGGVVGTGLGVYNLYQQGNPIDAFQENPAGYVADVASTAFSASTTAFLLAPNPITAGLVVGTGLVWAGAEIVDHWDDITEWTSDTWNSTTDWVGDRAGDFVDSQVDMLSDAWDVGTDVVGGVGDFIGGIDDWF